MAYKEELEKLIELLEDDIELTKGKINMEKRMQKMSLELFLISAFTLLCIVFLKVISSNNNAIVFDMLGISILVFICGNQLRDFTSCRSNLFKFDRELEAKESYLSKLNKELYLNKEF